MIARPRVDSSILALLTTLLNEEVIPYGTTTDQDIKKRVRSRSMLVDVSDEQAIGSQATYVVNLVLLAVLYYFLGEGDLFDDALQSARSVTKSDIIQARDRLFPKQKLSVTGDVLEETLKKQGDLLAGLEPFVKQTQDTTTQLQQLNSLVILLLLINANQGRLDNLIDIIKKTETNETARVELNNYFGTLDLFGKELNNFFTLRPDE